MFPGVVNIFYKKLKKTGVVSFGGIAGPLTSLNTRKINIGKVQFGKYWSGGYNSANTNRQLLIGGNSF